MDGENLSVATNVDGENLSVSLSTSIDMEHGSHTAALESRISVNQASTNDKNAKSVQIETKFTSMDLTSYLVTSSSNQKCPLEPGLPNPMNTELQEKMESEIKELKEELRLKRKELEECKCQIVGLSATLEQSDLKLLLVKYKKTIEIKDVEAELIRKEYEKQLLQKDIELIQKEYEKRLLQKDIDHNKDDARTYEKEKYESRIKIEKTLKEVESKCQRLQKEKEEAEERAMAAEKKCSNLADELKRLNREFEVSDDTS